MMEFVSWDDDIPNIWKNKIHVPNHQPENEGSECDTTKVTSGAGGVSDLWGWCVWASAQRILR